MGKFQIFVFLVIVMSATTVVAEGDAEAGKILGYTCTGCHGIPGYNNTYPTYKVPKIGGQNETYLVSALKAYRSGERKHATMQAQAQSMTDQDIENIAAWLARFEKEPAGETSAAPEAISAQVQVCASCHGNDGLAADPSYPALAGQYASYLEHALKSYRNGTRKNAIMGGFAANLTDQDIAGIAEWYSKMKAVRDLAGY